jgi:hypothetical protein
MPASVSSSFHTLYLSRNFELRTHRTNYLDSSGILKEAFERTIHVIKAGHIPKTDFPDSRVRDGVNIMINTFDDMLNSLPVLAGINIYIRSPEEKVRICTSSVLLVLR